MKEPGKSIFLGSIGPENPLINRIKPGTEKALFNSLIGTTRQAQQGEECHSTRGREAEWQEAEKKTMKNRRKVDSKDLPYPFKKAGTHGKRQGLNISTGFLIPRS